MMHTVDYQVMGDKVAVLPFPQETVSPGGILIPEMALQRPVRGTVTSVGPGYPNQPPMEVKVGDVVIYGRYSGTEITMDGKHADNRMEVAGKWALMMPERDVYAIEREGMLYPLANRVLIRPADAAEKIGEIYIPQSAQQKPTLGTVLQVGPGEKDKPMELKIGDTALTREWEGTEVDVMGEVMLLVRQDFVIAKGIPIGADVQIGECFDD